MIDDAREIALFDEVFRPCYGRERVLVSTWYSSGTHAGARGIMLEGYFYVGRGYDKAKAIVHLADLWGFVSLEVWCGRRVLKWLYEQKEPPHEPLLDVVFMRETRIIHRAAQCGLAYLDAQRVVYTRPIFQENESPVMPTTLSLF